MGPRWRNLFLYSNSLLLLGCVCACVASVKSLLWIVVEDQGLGYLFGGSSTLLTTLVIIFFCIPVSCRESLLLLLPHPSHTSNHEYLHICSTNLVAWATRNHQNTSLICPQNEP